MPLDYAYRVKEGQVVEIRPKVDRRSGGKELPIESKRFRGKITSSIPRSRPSPRPRVRIRAEFDNPDFELLPGLKVQMTIYLTHDVARGCPAGSLGEPRPPTSDRLIRDRRNIGADDPPPTTPTRNLLAEGC